MSHRIPMAAEAFAVRAAPRRIVTRLLRRARRSAETASALAGHVGLAVTMLGLLRPAAAILSYPRVLALARSVGLVRAAMPLRGRARRSQIRRTFGADIDASEATRFAAEYLARPLCDGVVLRRFMLRGWTDFANWRVDQRSTAAVDALRASDESFIVATGHFSRQAFMPLYNPGIVPQKITSILLPRTRRTIDPYTWWLSYHYGQMLDCLHAARPDMEFVHPRQTGGWQRLVETLGRPRNAVVVHADARAGQASGRYVRAFAGIEGRQFATGAARLSRVTGRPIAVCIPYLVDDETIVLDWTRVIRPRPGDDETSDIEVTNLILDDIEKAIGRRPWQYLLDYLGERSWDPWTEQWVAS
jgi:lauroyl/myristoyl acyltransferase